MSMLGAQLDDLDQLSAQLTRTTGDIAGCQQHASGATTTVVDLVRRAAAEALATITAEMEALRSSVQLSQSTADGALWTGANAEVFRHAAADFTRAMQVAEDATTDTFASFRTSIEAMSVELSDYATQLAGAMTDAQESTRTMASAVDAQRANLDEVMNTGMRVG